MARTTKIIGDGTPIDQLVKNPILEWLLRSRWIDTVEAFEALPEDWRRLLGGGEAQALIAEESSLPDVETLARMLGVDKRIVGDETDGDAGSAHSAVRLFDGFFPVRDQGHRGSCTAFATTALCEYGIGRKVRLSEQFLYWATKEISETALEDLADGAMFEAVQSALDHYGICPADDWTYSASPAGWSIAANPKFEHEGDARLVALKHAAQYRIHGFRSIPQGAIAQFRHSLARGFPVVVGIPCFMSWRKSEWVKRTGRLTMPLSMPITIPYPFGSLDALASQMRSNRGEDGGPLFREEVERQAAAMMMGYASSLPYIPAGAVPVLKTLEQEFAIFMITERYAGRHALCLAGYVDDETAPGGGYFIARNSWGEEWACESPEAAGYALIPYAYLATDVAPDEPGVSGFTFIGMPDIPQFAKDAETGGNADGNATNSGMAAGAAAGSAAPRQNGISGRAISPEIVPPGIAPHPSQTMAATPASGDDDFNAWIAERSCVLDRPVRDRDGILLRSGTSVLVPNPSNPSEVLRDTPQNRVKLRTALEREQAEALAAKEKAKVEFEAARLKELETRFEPAVLEAINGVFAADEYAVVTLAELKAAMLVREPELSAVEDIDNRMRATVIALQKGDRRRFWFGRGFGGREEIRPSGKDSDRVFV